MLLIILLLVLLSNVIESKRTFFNEGTIRGWDKITTEGLGTVEEVHDICFNGTSCLKFTQEYQPNYTGRYNNMAQVFDAARLGRTGYYGFAFKLSPDWIFDSNRITLMQFMADFSDVDCGRHTEKHWMPTVSVWVRNDKAYTRYRYGHPCDNFHNNVVHKITEEFKLGNVTPGVWHTVVLGIHWHRDKKGFFRAWYDENGPPSSYVLKVDEQFVHTLPELRDDRPFEFRLGINPFWYNITADSSPESVGDNIFVTPQQFKKSITYDKIGLGPEFINGDPYNAFACDWCGRGD